MKLTPVVFLLFTAFIMFVWLPFVNAQKLPSIQEKSVFAPSKIKIDGKPDEWQGKFEAYNHSTDLFYTLSNDHENIYLVIQAKDQITIKKIIAGGITLRLNGTGKRDLKSGVSITYASVNSSSKPPLGSWLNEKAPDKEPLQTRKNDSLSRLMNAIISSSVKEVKLTGVSTIADTLLSVYNTYGIKTAVQFNKDLWLTCELAIPLKYLDFISNAEPKIFYQIMLNGLFNAETVYIRNPRPNGPISVTSIPRSLSGGSNTYATQTINYPTDFWGLYILSK